MLKKVLTFAAVLAIVVASSLVSARRPKWHELDGYTFEKYVLDFGKRYKAGSAEFHMRKQLFMKKFAEIRAHNADTTSSWKAGVNMFTDMSAKEWKRFNGFRKSAQRPAPAKVYTGLETSAGIIPAEVDLRRNTEPRIITEVKHQGSCGCCWANSGTESMESYYALATGALPVLSFQQFASCTPQPMSYGCDGGDYAMGWMAINQTNYALTEEWCYGFTDFFFPTSGNPPTAACYNISSKFPNKHPYQWFAELVQVGISGYVSVTPNNATAMQKALWEVGPQSISVAAGCEWQTYESGVFTPGSGCSIDDKWSIDHAVQMVGYGRNKVLGKDYWIVRNSWSTLWGDNGYIYLERAANPNDEPCSPKEFGPVCGTSGCLSDGQYPLVTPLPGLPF